MEAHTIIVGEREFTIHRMNAFAANTLLMRIQKIALPVFASITSSGKSMGDLDVKEAAIIISEHLDESVMEKIVLPIFAESKLYLGDEKKFIKTATDIDKCFTTENLLDLYEVIFEVARYQFGPFFTRLMERFGNLAGGEKKA